MLFILHIIQIITAILLVGAIVVQQRGGGLSATFGGGGGVYHTRRGMEKMIFQATIVFAGLFFASAIINVVLQQQVLPRGNGGETASSTDATTTSPSTGTGTPLGTIPAMPIGNASTSKK